MGDRCALGGCRLRRADQVDRARCGSLPDALGGPGVLLTENRRLRANVCVPPARWTGRRVDGRPAGCPGYSTPMPSRPRNSERGVDLGLGLLLLTAGALVATGRLHGRRKAPA